MRDESDNYVGTKLNSQGLFTNRATLGKFDPGGSNPFYFGPAWPGLFAAGQSMCSSG